MAGYAYGGVYMLTIALTSIWLSNLGADWSVFELLFFVMVIAGVFFFLADIKNFRRNHAVIRSNFVEWLLMSLGVVGMWLCTYYSTMNGPADFFLALYFLSAAACVEFSKRRLFTGSACILAGALCFYAVPGATTLVLISSISGGLFGVLYSHFSKKLADAFDLSVMGILSIRFYLIILLVGLLYFFVPNQGVAEEHRHGWMVIFPLAALNVILPNSLSQATLHRLGVEKRYILMTLLPVMVALFEGIMKGQWNLLVFGAMISAALALNLRSVLAALFRDKEETAT